MNAYVLKMFRDYTLRYMGWNSHAHMHVTEITHDGKRKEGKRKP